MFDQGLPQVKKRKTYKRDARQAHLNVWQIDWETAERADEREQLAEARRRLQVQSAQFGKC